MGLEIDKFRETLPRTQFTDMGIGHEGTIIHQKWWKRVAATALFQPHVADSWLFFGPCTSWIMILISNMYLENMAERMVISFSQQA